jgi:hypothetical protein
MLGEIYRWIWRAGLLCLAVGGFVPLAAPPKNRPKHRNTAEADIDRATRLHDTLTTIGTQPISIEIILDPLNHEGEWDRFTRRMQDKRKHTKSATKKETQAFRRQSAREQRLKEQNMMDGTKKGLLPALYNETKYKRVKGHVIKDKNGELIVGKQAMLDRLMEHCEDVNSTTNTHPMEPREKPKRNEKSGCTLQKCGTCGIKGKGWSEKTSN